VGDPHSTEYQIRLAVNVINQHTKGERFFLFINVSAIHPPNHIFLPGAEQDSRATHEAALIYVDRHLPPLFETLRRRGPCLAILCSDHGTAYGEDGYYGHRLNHPVVWTVPYTEFLLAETLLPSI
jgi:hypothetical protein